MRLRFSFDLTEKKVRGNEMYRRIKMIALAAGTLLAPRLLTAQFDFKIDGRDVQVHSFAQQGFAYSEQNNFLSMRTNKGSFGMTDGGVNASVSITDKFRVGAQVYARNIGKLGDYHVQLDWAYGDYKFKDWFGIRGGKVKTGLGLFNDIQDMEFLQTWALLPQSVYPLDLRSNTIAHTGGDVYGEVPLRRAGSLSYTGYFGLRENDPYGGLYYGDAGAGSPVQSFSGKAAGGDVRWHTPVEGLMIGASWADQTMDLKVLVVAYGNAPLIDHNTPQHLTSGYADYLRGKWHFSSEFRRNYNPETYTVLGSTGSTNQSTNGWFGTAAYRVTKRLEIGTYNSRFYVEAPQAPKNTASNHIFDQTVTARFDITSWWNVKVEEHFMNGYGDTYSSHGFYSADNPGGLKPTTDMFVIRTAFYR
jgi:hypothetical protein